MLEKNCIWMIVVCVCGIIFTNATFFLRTPVVADEMLKEEVSGDVDGLFVPLPVDVAFEDVSIETDLSNINISVPEDDRNFYYENSLKGDGKHIQELLYGYENGVSVFDIKLNELCECSALPADGGIMISIEPIADKYDKIVIIDPAHGGEDTGTVSFDVKESYVNHELACAAAKYLRDMSIDATDAKANVTDVVAETANVADSDVANDNTVAFADNKNTDNIGVFLTRELDENPSIEERNQLVIDLKADVVLRIECRGDIKTRTKSGMEIVKGAEKNVKCITCYAGYLTNKMDATNLSDEKYIADAAEELSSAVMDELETK